MIRLGGIILVVLGLIIQPLMADVPTKLTDNNTDSAVALNVGQPAHVDGHSSHHVQKVSDTIKTACHEGAAASGPSSGTCDHCNTNCIDSGICEYSCVIGGAAVNHQLVVLSEQQFTTPIFGNAEHLGSGFLSRIYHPPKNS